MSCHLTTFLQEYENEIIERRREKYMTGEYVPVPLRGDTNKLTLGDLYFITYNFPDLTTKEERDIINVWYDLANKNKRGRSYYFFIEASHTNQLNDIDEASLRQFSYNHISNEDYGYAELNGDRVVYCLQIKSRVLRSQPIVDIHEEFLSLLEYADKVLYQTQSSKEMSQRVRFKEYSPPINLFELFELADKVWRLYHNKRELYLYKQTLFNILPKDLSLFPYVLDNILAFLIDDEQFVRSNNRIINEIKKSF
uniref:Uncharacterized protein n=1 Tax=viral metagenome TaxID=1070528 RepID=A0A6C0FGQ0_9ZZZZ